MSLGSELQQWPTRPHIPKLVEPLIDRILRAAELILLSGAFTWATIRSDSLIAFLGAGLFAILLLAGATFHIGYVATFKIAGWVANLGKGHRAWEIFATLVGLLVGIALTMVTAIAVQAVSEAIGDLSYN